MIEFVTRREFARHEGCDEKQVRRALAKGLLIADAGGMLDRAQVGSGWRKPRVDSKEPPVALRPVVRTTAGEDINNVRTNVRSVRSNVRTSATPGLQHSEAVGASTPQNAEGAGLRQAIVRKEDFAGRLKELEYRQKVGELVELALARQILFEEFNAARDTWQSWPARFAAQIAADLGTEQVDRVTAVLAAYVQKQLAALGEPTGEFKRG